MSIVQLTSSQRCKLQDHLRRTQDASHYRRLLAVLELDRGKTIVEVAALLRVTRQNVYNGASSYFYSCTFDLEAKAGFSCNASTVLDLFPHWPVREDASDLRRIPP